MRKTLATIVVLAVVCMLSVSSLANAAPSKDALPAESSPAVSLPQPMTDAEMAQVVGGQINVPPGQMTPPEPPLAGFIKSLSQQYGTNPGHLGTALGIAPGVATFIRYQFPSSSPGIGQLLR